VRARPSCAIWAILLVCSCSAGVGCYYANDRVLRMREPQRALTASACSTCIVSANAAGRPMARAPAMIWFVRSITSPKAFTATMAPTTSPSQISRLAVPTPTSCFGCPGFYPQSHRSPANIALRRRSRLGSASLVAHGGIRTNVDPADPQVEQDGCRTLGRRAMPHVKSHTALSRYRTHARGTSRPNADPPDRRWHHLLDEMHGYKASVSRVPGARRAGPLHDGTMITSTNSFMHDHARIRASTMKAPATSVRRAYEMNSRYGQIALASRKQVDPLIQERVIFKGLTSLGSADQARAFCRILQRREFAGFCKAACLRF